jgi:hypothetical protein
MSDQGTLEGNVDQSSDLRKSHEGVSISYSLKDSTSPVGNVNVHLQGPSDKTELSTVSGNCARNSGIEANGRQYLKRLICWLFGYSLLLA